MSLAETKTTSYQSERKRLAQASQAEKDIAAAREALGNGASNADLQDYVIANSKHAAKLAARNLISSGYEVITVAPQSLKAKAPSSARATSPVVIIRKRAKARPVTAAVNGGTPPGGPSANFRSTF